MSYASFIEFSNNYYHFIIMLQGMILMFLAVMEVGYNDQE